LASKAAPEKALFWSLSVYKPLSSVLRAQYIKLLEQMSSR